MSSQISIFDGQNPLKIKKPIRLIELFAGIGAQAKALERLGVEFEHYRVCEFDKFAVTSYNAIHGTNFEPTDIMSWNGSDLCVVDTDLFTYILTYSFPCQDLSVCGKKAGMGEGSGTRSALLWEVKRLLTETKNLPQILVMENVPAVIGKKNIDSFMQWVKFLDGLGYKSKWSIMNARDYEVPQNRERCFMVSWLGDYYYDFPTPKPLKKVLRDILIPDDEVEERYYLSEKGMNYVLRRGGTFCISTEPILVGGYGVKKSNGGTQWFQQDRVYSADAVAMAHPASISCGSYAYFVGGKSPLRRLTPLECWRLMDFEDADFERAKRSLNETFYKGNDKSSSHLYQQAGNSIVVNCLVEIFRKML